ncbi:hypothetical protein [Salinimicrobium oceani]|uniref:Lipocalin-like domain-containing protein n=1 Tax=Salinimicrobium oceani TaxID=2722702 RepID=A0ABX1D0Q0_9FLAO|nr:hypothetical protein [Salinimicrobium oceani]NJW52426.1 hypothetical protein [Salinimicrobium oceani]
MKRTACYILLLNLLIGCLASNSSIPAEQLMGRWFWTESSGGIAGTTQTPKTSEETVILEINSSSIKRYVNGRLESTRNYTLEIRESLIYGDSREMIIYENGMREMFSVSPGELFLTGDCYDCFQSRYERDEN